MSLFSEREDEFIIPTLEAEVKKLEEELKVAKDEKYQKGLSSYADTELIDELHRRSSNLLVIIEDCDGKIRLTSTKGRFDGRAITWACYGRANCRGTEKQIPGRNDLGSD